LNFPPPLPRFTPRRKGFTSSYPARRPNTDCRNNPAKACRPFFPVRASARRSSRLDMFSIREGPAIHDANLFRRHQRFRAGRYELFATTPYAELNPLHPPRASASASIGGTRGNRAMRSGLSDGRPIRVNQFYRIRIALSRLGYCFLRVSGLRARAWLAMVRPSRHESPTLFQSVPAPVSLFGFIADDMSQGGFGNLARKMRLVPRPIPKG
jgi:hypothetical protein